MQAAKVMNTRSRAVKIDENEGQKVTKKAVGNVGKTIGTTATTAVTKRAALGELGNRAIPKTTDAQKDTTISVKNVKPRVDTHWKKNEHAAPAATVTGKVSIDAKIPKAKVITAATAKSKLVEDKTKRQPAAVTGQQQQPVLANIRREESNISRRSLTKLKAGLCKDRKDKSEVPHPILKHIEINCKITAHSSALLEQVENIDAGDSDNPILVSQYVNDIYSYLYELEMLLPVRKMHLDKQAEVSHKMRAVLLDWINEVHYQFRLLPETYHLTVSIIDRYLQKVTTTQRQYLQLVGVAALFLASKYEELYPPEITDFVYIADDTYTKQQILSMEQRIIRNLEFSMGRPSSIHFLRRYSKAANASDEIHMLAKYLIELVSIEYEFAHYRPSIVAAASLHLSLILFNKNPARHDSQLWTSTLQFYSTYSAAVLKPVVEQIAAVLKKAPKAQLKAIYNKYSSSKFEKISLKIETNSVLQKMVLE